MKTCYFKANAETEVKIKEMMKGLADIKKRGHALAKEIGADPKEIIIGECWGRWWVAGFRFAQDPDPQLFCKLKSHPGCWRPRARTEIDNRMRELNSTAVGDIAKLVGMEMFQSDGRVYSPGISIQKNGVYLALSEGSKGTGCERITDIEWEKATSPKRKKRVRV
ncbi:hypothetical protein SH661x_001841 [Planctomicrobium sp. SH661]|uniref:hypothetical protein n=1 Tax=Planctomicrobium sp. SH661 TaxID=3448124 RepID=UPI003F5BBE5B